MSSNFEFFNANQARNDTPKITIRRNGVIVMNAGAVKLMVNGDEDVTHVRVAYNRENRAIGIVPAADDDAGKFRLRRQNKSTSRTINARRLFEHYTISVEKATSYDVESFEGGLVGVTLSEDSQVTAETRTTSSKRKARSS